MGLSHSNIATCQDDGLIEKLQKRNTRLRLSAQMDHVFFAADSTRSSPGGCSNGSQIGSSALDMARRLVEHVGQVKKLPAEWWDGLSACYFAIRKDSKNSSRVGERFERRRIGGFSTFLTTMPRSGSYRGPPYAYIGIYPRCSGCRVTSICTNCRR